MELWKDVDWIDGYKGVMQVSNHGRVRRTAYSYKTTGRWGTLHTTSKPAKYFAMSNESHGYDVVAIQVNGKRKKFLVHRLVGRAFVPGFSPELTINHINCVKTDNRAENLEWVTRSVNTKKQWVDNLVSGTPKKLSSGKVRIIREAIALGLSPGKIATLCGVDAKLIYRIKAGIAWRDV